MEFDHTLWADRPWDFKKQIIDQTGHVVYAIVNFTSSSIDTESSDWLCDRCIHLRYAQRIGNNGRKSIDYICLTDYSIFCFLSIGGALIGYII